MSGTTCVNVRVQANGGKYLGPALAMANQPPMLTVTVPGQVPQGPMAFPTDSSGMVNTDPNGASPYPIVVQPPATGFYMPGTYYLHPDANGGPTPLQVWLDIPIGTASDVVFTVEAFAPQPLTFSTVVRIKGGSAEYAGDNALVLLVPGLRITGATATTGGSGIQVTANVAMMCGCKITADKADPMEKYWPAYEFEVVAYVADRDIPAVALECLGTDMNDFSVFSGVIGQFPPGTSQVVITAVQRNSPNSNTAVTFFTFIEPKT